MKIFNTLTKKIAAAVAIVAAVAGITGGAIAGFGPGRETKQYVQGMHGFDYPVFNSFVGVPGIGDERTFFTGSYPSGTVLTDPLAEAKEGDVLTLQVYAHNNADPSHNADGSGIAKDTVVKVELPSGNGTSRQAKATISSSNTNPKEVYDTLDFGMLDGSEFGLVYELGSAHIRGNYVNTGLGDEIVTTGVKIGSVATNGKFNGDVKGCFDQEVLVTLKVRVVKPKKPGISLDKTVRKLGTTTWSKDIVAAPGDVLEYNLHITNSGETPLTNVLVGDRLPPHQSYVAGSTKLINSLTTADGIKLNDGVVPGAIRLNATYKVGSQADVRFQAKVDANIAQTECGNPRFRNIGTTRADGIPTDVESSADVVVNTGKTCEVVVVKECKAFDFVKINRTTFDFTATARVQNANVTSYVFTAKDKNGNVVDTKTVTTNATNANYRFVKDVPGNYTVSAVINTDKGVATGTCEKTVTVTEVPVTPTYSCDGVTIAKIGGRKVRISVATTADPSNRVQVKNYEYNFGDGSAVQTTDKNPNEYEYAKDGTYNVSVKVNFMVDGVMKTSTQKCEAVVTFAPTPVTELPKTGASATLGMFITTTMVSMLAFRAYAIRKN